MRPRDNTAVKLDHCPTNSPREVQKRSVRLRIGARDHWGKLHSLRLLLRLQESALAAVARRSSSFPWRGDRPAPPTRREGDSRAEGAFTGDIAGSEAATACSMYIPFPVVRRCCLAIPLLVNTPRIFIFLPPLLLAPEKPAPLATASILFSCLV